MMMIAGLLVGSLVCLAGSQRTASRSVAALSATEWRGLQARRLRHQDVALPGARVTGVTARPVRTAGPDRLPPPPAFPGVLARQAAAYAAERPKRAIDLQRFRRTSRMTIEDGRGRRGRATLINLTPTINAWYLLELTWAGREPTTYHLTNTHPDRQDLTLDSGFRTGLVIVDTTRRMPCDLWSANAPLPIGVAAASASPYVILCEGEVSLRLGGAGHKAAMEQVTDFLRDEVWGGEAMTGFVKRTFFRDAFLSTAELIQEVRPDDGGADGPSPVRVDRAAARHSLVPTGLGIALEHVVNGRVAVGGWYRARHVPGVFVSVVQPRLVAPEIRRSHRDHVSALDELEGQALAYLVAFDLDRFEMGFVVGTDHPRVGWSERVPARARDDSLPGPDGIDTIVPLVATGIVGPGVADRVVATFTGGFKRTHGAFKFGDLAVRNHGTHYGFLESGVVFSKLQPGLATIVGFDDGTVAMKTWTEADEPLLPHVWFARQNGVPLIEVDPEGGAGVPGALVSRWGAGNWSGAVDGRFRSLRAGICLQTRGRKRFLIYGYFSDATPSAMVRVFQACRCRYAMHLDMNALEHTYLALYHLGGSELVVEHVIDAMRVLDRTDRGRALPRFLGFADNRDFFYLIRRGGRNRHAHVDRGVADCHQCRHAGGPGLRPGHAGRAQ